MASTLYIEIRGDYSQFQKDLARVRGIARQNGEAISNSLNNAISPDKAVKGVSKLTQALRQAQAAATSKGMQPAINGLEELAKAAGMSAKEMRTLQQAMIATARKNSMSQALADIQRQTGYTNMQMAALRISIGDVGGGFMAMAKSAASAVKYVAAIGAGLLAAGKTITDTKLQFDRIDKAFTAITGSSERARQELDFIRETSASLGLEFLSTAESAKTFFAAAQGTNLQNRVREIFTAFSEAGTAMSLTSEQMSGIFLALGQMISKGKVQAEELRGQLGERLPGAFQLAAKAMNMTTAELDKFMADGKLTADDLLPRLAAALKDQYEEPAKKAAKGIQCSINGLITEWQKFKAEIVDNETVIAAINLLSDAIAKLGKAAGLRSISETVNQGANLAQRGLLDWDKFIKAGFFERQEMVDDGAR